jgi:PAS domain S-box-containing protein
MDIDLDQLTDLKLAALETTADAILIVNRQGEILWANQAIERLTGFNPQELIGHNPRILKSGQHTVQYYQEMWDTILAGRIWRGETINRRKDGDLYYEEQTITPIPDGDGIVQHFIAVKHDISQRKRAILALERKNQELYGLIEALPAMVYLKAPDYTIRYANRLFQEVYGDPTGRFCYQILHNRQQPCEDCKTHEVFLKGHPINWERYIDNKKSYQIYDYPFTDIDGEQLVLEMAVDISEITETRLALEKKNQELIAATQASESQVKLVEALFKAAASVVTDLELDKVLAQILEQILKVIPCKAGAVGIVEGDQICMTTHEGLRDIPALTPLLGTQIPLSTFWPFEVVTDSRQPFLVEDRYQHFQQYVEGLDWVQSYAVTPMLTQDHLIGLIILLSEQKSFFKPEMNVPLQAFAVHGALAIQNARYFDQVRHGQKNLFSLSQHLVELQENERRLIAQELHDEAGQALTSLKVGLSLLEKSAHEPETVRQVIQELTNQVDVLYSGLHRLAVDLRPAILDHLGLEAALRQLMENLMDKLGIQAELVVLHLDERLPEHIEISLYRIFQEALTNIVQHANASSVHLLLEKRGEKIIGMIEDDGIGFNYSAKLGEGRLGLFGLCERAEMLGGKLLVDSEPEKGTTIFFEVPYDH